MLSLILFYLFTAIEVLLVIYCVFSWFIRDSNNKIYAFLATLCEPILKPFQMILNKIPFLNGSGIDFSPILLLFVLRLAFQLLSGIL